MSDLTTGNKISKTDSSKTVDRKEWTAPTLSVMNSNKGTNGKFASAFETITSGPGS